MEGSAIPVMVTFETDDTHGALEIDHRKTLAPVPRPVNVVLGSVGFVMVPLPEIKVHEPVPTAGVLPVNVAPDETQTV
jgi:hypothetical protein